MAEKIYFLIALLSVAWLTMLSTGAVAEEPGETLFKKNCAICHTLEADEADPCCAKTPSINVAWRIYAAPTPVTVRTAAASPRPSRASPVSRRITSSRSSRRFATRLAPTHTLRRICGAWPHD